MRFWSLSTETLPHKNVLVTILAAEFSYLKLCASLVVIGDGKALLQAYQASQGPTGGGRELQ